MRDSLHGSVIKRVISSTRVSDNTAQVGQIIDIQGFDSLLYAINAGTLADADATFAVLLEESDASDMTGATTVADADMISETVGTAPLTAAGFKFDSDNQVRTLGYIGNKRYTRLTVTPANNTGNADFGVTAQLGRAGLRPTVQGTA